MLPWLSVSSRVVSVGKVVLEDGVSCGRTGDVQATVVPWLIDPKHTEKAKKNKLITSSKNSVNKFKIL